MHLTKLSIEDTVIREGKLQKMVNFKMSRNLTDNRKKLEDWPKLWEKCQREACQGTLFIVSFTFEANAEDF